MTSIKTVQLWLHHHFAQIRHWLLVIIGTMLLIFSMVSFANQNRLIDKQNQLIAKVAVLAEQNRILSEQNKQLNTQSKNLGVENQSIAKQDRAYTRCIAQIFAQYTREFQPITITNLDTCTTDSQSQETNNTPVGGTLIGGAQSTNPSPPPTSPPTPPSQPTSPPVPPQDNPSFLEDLLGGLLGGLGGLF